LTTKSVAAKLLIEPDSTVWSSHASLRHLIEPLPARARHVDGPEQATTALVLADDAGSLRAVLAAHKDRLAQPDTFWVAYPKANRAAINRDSLWPLLGAYGMRPIGQVSVDDVWSAMCFRPKRDGDAPSTRRR
jgi:hypothetical protein